MEISITTSQSAVLAEVARKSAYTGAKLEGDDNAVDRITTVDEDAPELKSFFDECRTELADYFQSTLAFEGIDAVDNDTYTLSLNVSDSFNTALLPSLQIALHTFFVYGILARWFVYTHMDGAELYAEQSAASLHNLWSRTLMRAFTRGQSPF